MENAANDKRLKIIKSQINGCTGEIKEIDYLLNNKYRLYEFYVFDEKTGNGQQVQIDNDIIEEITEYALNEHRKRVQEKKLKAWEKLIGE
jgi:hypothetical protein